MPNILMPALSPTMEEGELAKWLKKVGDSVKAGDVIAEIETDKATMEVEAVDEGKLTQILVPEGAENVKVNTPIAGILGEGEEPPAPANKAEATTQAKAEPKPAPAKAEAKTEAPPAPAVSPALKDPEIPEGTEMISMTVREALRRAMSEEMRRDKDVFLIGEEVGQYQ